MKRRRGIFGYIYALISFVIIVAIAIAILRQFNGDIIEAISWFISWIGSLIGKVADKFTNMPKFRGLFK